MENPPDDSIKESQDKILIEAEDTSDHICSPKNCTKKPELYITSLKCNACESCKRGGLGLPNFLQGNVFFLQIVHLLPCNTSNKNQI